MGPASIAQICTAINTAAVTKAFIPAEKKNERKKNGYDINKEKERISIIQTAQLLGNEK